MKRPKCLAGLIVFLSAIAIWFSLLLPGTLKLRPRYRRTTGLQDWDLIACAQHLVARKFAIYSTRNLWDTPDRAFEYGMGYCTQYNLALKQLLDRLDFDTAAVFARKVRMLTDPNWAMGHTWLRVTVQDEVREVCAGCVTNEPGRNNFEPLTPVHHGSTAILLLMHFGMLPFCGFVEWRALLSGKGDPGWTFRQKSS